ncbi:MAG: glutamine synthetase family protein [Pseudomonadota bacterium]
MTAPRTEFFLLDPGGVERGKWAPGKPADAVAASRVAFPLSMTGLDVWGREVVATGLHIESGDLDGACAVVPGSVRPMPWVGDDVVDAMLEMRLADGTPFYGDSRNALRSAMLRLEGLGVGATIAMELEFYLFDPAAADPTGPVERQAMYDLKALSGRQEFFDAVRRAAEAQDVPADTIISEAAQDQYEVNLVHRADAMAAADDAVRLRRIVRGAAARHGLEATFMAKPYADRPGNGLHVHVSLVTGEGRNLFGETDDGADRLQHAVGGLIETMQDGMLVFANTRNGFRRFAPASYAPNRLNWGENNRSVAIRIPASGPQARRFEHRIAGADANPYLVLALILQGAAHGMEHGIAPPAPCSGNAYEGDAPFLESAMRPAIDCFLASEWIRSVMGPDLQAHIAAVKRQECAAFDEHICGFESDTYR